MFAGLNFPSLFDNDNFTLRRTTGHNMYDPESLITGAEIDSGMTYTNSARNWSSEKDYLAAVAGEMSVDSILVLAPRVLRPADYDSRNRKVWNYDKTNQLAWMEQAYKE
jgi:hypothetical protein